MAASEARREASGRRSNGFSIIELMIVIAIVGVLAAVAIPAFDDLIKNNRRAVVVNELVSDVMVARGESAKRGQAVSICGNTSSGGTSCTGGATWDYGWMIFLDPDADGAIAAVGDVLKQYKNDYGDIKVRSSIGGGPVTIRPFNQGGTGGTITVCDKRGAAKARAVVVENNGRPRSSEKNKDNGALTCPS